MLDMYAQSGDLTAQKNDGEDGATTDTGDFHDTDGQETQIPNTDEQDNSDELNSDTSSTTDDEESQDESDDVSTKPDEDTADKGKYYTQDEINRMMADRARRERESALKTDPVRQFVEQRASKLGMTPEQLMRETERMEAEDETKRIAQENNIPEHIAQDMQRQAAEKRSRITQEKEQQMYRDFMTTHPDVQPSQISEDTWYQVKVLGKSLTEAYSVQRVKELTTKMQQLEKGKTVRASNEANKKSAPGKVGGTATQSGFITEKEYTNMSLQQLTDPAVYKRVEDSMKHW